MGPCASMMCRLRFVALCLGAAMVFTLSGCRSPKAGAGPGETDDASAARSIPGKIADLARQRPIKKAFLETKGAADDMLGKEKSGAAGDEAPVQHTVGHRILYYIPNRLLDLVDIVRLRVRAGPGLALDARGTDYLAFYGGTYNSVYLGLPGPRMEPKLKSPVGREQLKGIVFFGVDATDNTARGPEYSPTEFDLGAQLLLVGVDVGFDPVELGDFLTGFFMMDTRRDDL